MSPVSEPLGFRTRSKPICSSTRDEILLCSLKTNVILQHSAACNNSKTMPGYVREHDCGNLGQTLHLSVRHVGLSVLFLHAVGEVR